MLACPQGSRPLRSRIQAQRHGNSSAAHRTRNTGANSGSLCTLSPPRSSTECPTPSRSCSILSRSCVLRTPSTPTFAKGDISNAQRMHRKRHRPGAHRRHHGDRGHHDRNLHENRSGRRDPLRHQGDCRPLLRHTPRKTLAMSPTTILAALFYHIGPAANGMKTEALLQTLGMIAHEPDHEVFSAFDLSLHPNGVDFVSQAYREALQGLTRSAMLRKSTLITEINLNEAQAENQGFAAVEQLKPWANEQIKSAATTIRIRRNKNNRVRIVGDTITKGPAFNFETVLKSMKGATR